MSTLETIAHLDFDPTEEPDHDLCEVAPDGTCTNHASWRWVPRTGCPHDGTPQLYCQRHKDFADHWLSVTSRFNIQCGYCSDKALLLSWSWERL